MIRSLHPLIIAHLCVSSVLCVSSFLREASCAEKTSENDVRLRAGLARFPAADTDGDGILTQGEARAFLAKRESASPDAPKAPAKAAPLAPTRANLAYGPDERNVLDLWLADSPAGEAAPLLLCIHGGGFRSGDKSKYANDRALLDSMLKAGISVAAINYRLTDGGNHPYPAPMHDGARALQFLRCHAGEYGLDKTRIAATGNSAGACISMWLAFHKDLADPDSKDPVLRESTRLTAIAPHAGQPSVHNPTLLEWFAVDNLPEHPGGRPLFGLPLEGDIEWTPELDALTRDASPITHLTKDAPPVFMTYGEYKPVHGNMASNAWVHHPIMGIKLKEQMDALDLECHCLYPGGPEDTAYASEFAFLIDKLSSK